MHKIIQAHIPCPLCGSSDGATEYEDGYYCFVCETSTPKHQQEQIEPVDTRIHTDLIYQDLTKRGIKKATCIKYHYGIHDNLQVASYIQDGKIIFQKTRDRDKNFKIIGKNKHIFFGQHLFAGGRKLVITEGEIDCLTVSQLNDNKYPVVSLPHGCNSAEKAFKENYDWLCRFDEVILMFDMDEAGQKAVAKVAGLLPPHKTKIAVLPLKDANECLMAGRGSEVIRAIWDAQEYKPDGILNPADMEEELFSEKADVVSFNFPWGTLLNAKTQGIRKGELLLLTAGSGIGKSTLAREIAYKLKTEDNLKIGFLMLEETPIKTIRDLLSIHMQRPLHLDWTEETKAEVRKHYAELFGDRRIVLYDHFGSIEADNLLEKIRYMITGEECDFIVLDHISIAISGLDVGDERKTIDLLMTKLRSLVAETGVGIIIVSHLRKTGNNARAFEEGGEISLDDLRGSGSLKQLPDTIIALERNQQAEEAQEKDKLNIRLLKCRFSGETGLTDNLFFNKNKHRLEYCQFDTEEEEEDNDF